MLSFVQSPSTCSVRQAQVWRPAFCRGRSAGRSNNASPSRSKRYHTSAPTSSNRASSKPSKQYPSVWSWPTSIFPQPAPANSSSDHSATPRPKSSRSHPPSRKANPPCTFEYSEKRRTTHIRHIRIDNLTIVLRGVASDVVCVVAFGKFSPVIATPPTTISHKSNTPSSAALSISPNVMVLAPAVYVAAIVQPPFVIFPSAYDHSFAAKLPFAPKITAATTKVPLQPNMLHFYNPLYLLGF